VARRWRRLRAFTSSTSGRGPLFKRQILLEPLIAGQAQHNAVIAAVKASPSLAGMTGDEDNLRKPVGWVDTITKRATESMTDPSTLRDILGVEPSSQVGRSQRGSEGQADPRELLRATRGG
jgi:hypothetical protein